MEREWERRPPDHEGYIAFKKDLTEKDSNLAARAFDDQGGESAALRQYFELWCIESDIWLTINEPVAEIMRHRRNRVAEIGDDQTRQRVIADIDKKLSAWDSARSRYHVSHLEHLPDDITAEMQRHRAAHPEATRSQAMFQAIFKVKDSYSNGLSELQADLHNDIDRIINSPPHRNPPQRGERGYAEWRDELRRQHRERER